MAFPTSPLNIFRFMFMSDMIVFVSHLDNMSVPGFSRVIQGKSRFAFYFQMADLKNVNQSEGCLDLIYKGYSCSTLQEVAQY